MAFTISLGRNPSISTSTTTIDLSSNFYWAPVKSLESASTDGKGHDVFNLQFLCFNIWYSRPTNPKHWERVKANKLRMYGKFMRDYHQA